MPLVEFEALKDDIALHGVREPVWTKNNAVIDGRHRWLACEELGLECPIREYDGDDLVSFVVSLNLRRRHLDESQRAMVAASLATLPFGANQHAQICAPSQSAAAELLNVSRRSVQNAAAVRDSGVPELVAAVQNGSVSVSAATEVAELDADTQRAIVEEVVGGRKASEVIREYRPHVANNSGNNEWYTPPAFIAAACAVMGTIDVDPASSAIANETVGATTYFDADVNGLEQAWSGNVWLNPPYSQPLIGHFCEAVSARFESAQIRQACVLVNNATETVWFQRLLSTAAAVCLVRARVRFLDPDGNPGAPLQGQAVVYMGPNREAFVEAFSSFGFILFAL